MDAGAGETEETLRDGRVVTVRPLRADDAAGVEALWRRPDARARRLHSGLAGPVYPVNPRHQAILDLNPVFVRQRGAVVADVRARPTG